MDLVASDRKELKKDYEKTTRRGRQAMSVSHPGARLPSFSDTPDTDQELDVDPSRFRKCCGRLPLVGGWLPSMRISVTCVNRECENGAESVTAHTDEIEAVWAKIAKAFKCGHCNRECDEVVGGWCHPCIIELINAQHSAPRKKPRRTQIAVELRDNDLSARGADRNDIEYGPSDSLPGGDHIIRMGAAKKRG